MNFETFIMVWLAFGVSYVFVISWNFFSDMRNYKTNPEKLRPKRLEAMKSLENLVKEGEDLGITIPMIYFIISVLFLIVMFFVVWTWPISLVRSVVRLMNRE